MIQPYHLVWCILKSPTSSEASEFDSSNYVRALAGGTHRGDRENTPKFACMHHKNPEVYLKFRRVKSTPDPDTFEKYRDTPPISMAYFCKSMPPSWQKVVYTPPTCITIRLPFVSRYFCRSIRVRGRESTPKKSHCDCPYFFNFISLSLSVLWDIPIELSRLWNSSGTNFCTGDFAPPKPEFGPEFC